MIFSTRQTRPYAINCSTLNLLYNGVEIDLSNGVRVLPFNELNL